MSASATVAVPFYGELVQISVGTLRAMEANRKIALTQGQYAPIGEEDQEGSSAVDEQLVDEQMIVQLTHQWQAALQALEGKVDMCALAVAKAFAQQQNIGWSAGHMRPDLSLSRNDMFWALAGSVPIEAIMAILNVPSKKRRRLEDVCDKVDFASRVELDAMLPRILGGWVR